jgi:hypothetical protein
MTNKYEQHSLVRLKATFRNAALALTDPTTVSIKITLPDKSATTYVYGTDSEVVKDSTGVYYMDFSCDTAGIHKYHWHGTGAVQAAKSGEFWILEE